MTITIQNTLDAFCPSCILERATEVTRATFEEPGVEQGLSLLASLLDSDKFLFDLALKSGFRILGATE